MTTTRPKCGAKTRNGGTCQNAPLPGATRCRMHGGASPRAQAKARERLAIAAAEREVARLGARRDIHPAEALLDLVHWTAGEVDYWRHHVTFLAEQDPAALTWGVSKTTETDDGDQDTTREAKPHVAYVMLERASDRLAGYAAAALKAGVQERQVQLAESQGVAVAAAQRTILDRMLAAMVDLLRAHGVGDDAILDALRVGWAAAMGVIVPEELRRLGGGGAT